MLLKDDELKLNSNESIYQSNLPIKYVFEKSEKNTSHLVIVFSSFATKNVVYAYNYVRTLKCLDCHKLFILDNYGPEGCYYLGENMSFQVETAVTSLIMSIIRETNVPLQNVITAGSSKGGTAALYFGLKYNLGYVFAGAPQIHIGDYILSKKATAEYMLGVDITNEKINILNSLIYKQLEREICTEINILTSENDQQFDKHIIPFLDFVKRNNININCVINNEIKNHSDIANHYRSFLRDNIMKVIFGYEPNCKRCELDFHDGKIMIKNDNFINRTSKVVYKYEVWKNNLLVVESENISFFEYVLSEEGVYKVYLNIYIDDRKVVEYFLGKYTWGNKEFVLHNVIFEIDNDRNMYFELEIEEKNNLQYAYYILKDNNVIEKIMYNNNKFFRKSIKESGSYKVKYFILTSNKIKVVDSTAEIIVGGK